MSEEPILLVDTEELTRLVETPKRRRRFLMAAGVLAPAALALAAILWPETGETALASRADVVHSVVALGRVESESTCDVVPRITARIAAIHVKEGDEVAAGQLLVTLEDTPIRAAHEEAVRARDAAKARHAELCRGARSEDLALARARHAEAERMLRISEARAAEVLRGARREEIQEAEGHVAEAKAESDFAARDWERYGALDGTVSQQERDAARRRHEAAKARLRQAEARRDRLVNGATDEEKTQAREGVEAARARVEQAAAALARLDHGATREERDASEAALKQAEAAVARLAFELDQTKLVAPARAIVARRYREPSELASPAMPAPILVLAGLEDRVVRMEVLEADLYKVRAGQEATVRSDSFPGRTWRGTVTRLAPTMGRKRLSSEHPREKSDVKILEVTVTIDERADLPLNLPVEVSIREIVGRNVLVVPARAVRAGAAVVRADGSELPVTCGVRDDAVVEIASGLREGERVRLAP